MVLDPNARTGLFVSLTETGERDFVFFRNPSADMTFRPDELAESSSHGPTSSTTARSPD